MRVYVTLSLSLSLQSLINPYSILIIISSLCLIINKTILFCIILMLHSKISSLSSTSTFAFDTLSIETDKSEDKLPSRKSFICFNERNFNQNARDTDEDLNNEKKFLHRLIQSSTDITTNDLYSSINRENLAKNNGAIRIESALMTSDYSHLLIHASRPTIDRNMNRTIDLIKRNGAGDENSSKPIPTQTITDTNHYLTLEQVPIHNRRTIQFTSKQLILISISVFVFVILLCLTTIFFIL